MNYDGLFIFSTNNFFTIFFEFSQVRNLKMFTKLFLSHIAVGLVAIISLAAILYAVFSDNLIQRTLNQLSSVNILKEELVANYFLRSQQNLEALQLEQKFLKIFRTVSATVEKGISVHTSDMQDVENICRLYNFKNIHLFDLHHRELFSSDTTRYRENVLQRIDSAITVEPNRLRLVDASHTSNDKQTLLFHTMYLSCKIHNVSALFWSKKILRMFNPLSPRLREWVQRERLISWVLDTPCVQLPVF